MIKLRLKRYGGKKQSCYRIVAMDSRTKRDGASIEELGYYNPLTKETKLDVPNIIQRLDEGVKPTDTVKNLLVKAEIIKA